MFIDGSCDIEFWCLNMQIEGNETSHDMELKNEDLKTQVQRHEVKSKFKCDIGFWCLNMRIQGIESSHDMELKNQDFETQAKIHDENKNFEEGVDKSASLSKNVHRWLV